MPNLCNTSLSTVMEFGSRLETGRYLFQFPKLKTSTDFDLFIIDPHSGQIQMYDDDNDITYPFSVKASRMKRKNSQVIELIKTAVRDQKRKELAKQKVPGGNMRPPTDSPYTIEQLGEVLGIYEDCREKRATIALAIHELMQKNTRDKWAIIGANEALSEKIRDRIEEIFINLGKDIGLRHQFGKSTYTLPKVSLRNNIIDSEISFGNSSSGYQSNPPRNSAYNNTTRSPSPNQSYRQDRHGAPVGQQRYPQNNSNNYNPNRSYQQGNVQGNTNNYNNSYNGGYNNSYSQGSQNQSGPTIGYNQGRRYINKYRHPRGNPKDDIKFEFVDNNKYDILKTLRGILRYFEDVPAGNRAAYPSRYQGEVNEADIQEISMPELCHMMGASVDNIYEALVAGDYIEEIVNTA